MPVHSVILEAIVWSKLYIFHRHHSDDSERWDRAEAHDEDGGSHTLKIDILTHLCSALVYPSPCHDEHKTSNAHIHLPWPWPLAPFDGCLAWLDAATRVLQPPGGGGDPAPQPHRPALPPPAGVKGEWRRPAAVSGQCRMWQRVAGEWYEGGVTTCIVTLVM